MSEGLSGLIFGTMRLGEVDRSIGEWVEYFHALHRLGIRALHSSAEYDTFDLVREIVSTLDREHGLTFDHLVKLAEPSFDDSDLSPARLREKVARYSGALPHGRLFVQWMWRHGLDDDAARIEAFRNASGGLAGALDELRREGEIAGCYCFPYTPAFADAALGSGLFDGLAVYCNELERDYRAAIAKAAETGSETVVIRPLAGGRTVTQSTASPRDQVRSILAMPGVSAAVLSSNSLAHVENLLS